MVLGTAIAFLCQATDVQGRTVKSLLELRQENVVVQKWDLSCGAAALATILNYQFGDRVTEREITAYLIRRPEYLSAPEIVRVRQGFSMLDLKRYVESRGYKGNGYGKLTLDDLVELAPILVPVNFNGANHFVVFRGVEGDRVFLADPAFGNRTMPLERFEEAWIDSPVFGRVGFVVTRPGAIPSRNRLAPNRDDAVSPTPDMLRRILGLGR